MSEKCEKIENENCPLISGNPGICPFAERIASIETHISYLKAGYWIQILISLSILGLTIWKAMLGG